MQARIHQYAASRFTRGELLRSGRPLLAAIGLVPGFVSFILLDDGDGRLTSCCICEEPAALDGVDAVASVWMAEHVGSATGSTGVTTGEIVLQRGL